MKNHKNRISWFISGCIALLMFTHAPRQFRLQAAGIGPTLAILPAAKQLAVSETAVLGISVNTGGDSVSAAEVHLAYDPSALQVTSFTPTAALPVVLSPATIANGNIRVILGVNPAVPLKGSAVIGTITIKLLTNRQSDITFAADTAIASLGKNTNTLAASTGTTITPAGLPTEVPLSGTKVGDANGDGKVDGVDYVVWLTHYNQSVSGPSNGDFNNSGRIDGIDYVIWLNNYGT